MPVNIKAAGFTEAEIGPIKVLGPTIAMGSAVPDSSYDFGQGNVILFNGANPQYQLPQFSQFAATLPVSAGLYVAPPEAKAQFGFLRTCHIKSMTPSLAFVPPSFAACVTQFIGGPLGASPLSGFTPTGQTRTMNFMSSESWKSYVVQTKEFLSKSGIKDDMTDPLLRRLELAVVNNPAGLEYYMDADVFLAGVNLPLDVPESKVVNETMQFFEGAAGAPADGVPGGLVFLALKHSHFVLVRKAPKGLHLCVAYFLKAAPPFTGFSIRFDRAMSGKGFDTMDPNSLASSFKASGTSASAPTIANEVSNTTMTSAPANSDQLRIQLKQVEILNNIYLHANKILGEEIKRLLRQRKEPSTDEELKFSRTQLEIKIKKLLVRLSQYDATLRNTTGEIEKLKAQITHLMEEKTAAEAKVKTVENELIQARTGTGH